MKKTSSEQIRSWQGPEILSFGFRPFFLFGAIWNVFAMLTWILVLNGMFSLPSRFDPVSWHAHEFLFGYVGAILGGFLLTATPNWTGRLPIVGWRLLALFSIWCVGRISVLVSAVLPISLGIALDVAFPIILLGFISQEITAGKNWNNTIVLIILLIFAMANVLFHFEAITEGYAFKGSGLRLGLASVVFLNAVIGGRIIPSFTRNWLAKNYQFARPVPSMQKFDKITLFISFIALLAWVSHPVNKITAFLLLVFGILDVARLVRWRGYHALKEPLIWFLHLAYAFIPLGAITLAADIFFAGIYQVIAQHIWMAGVIGAMTLAIMTRATLGHTGQELVANWGTIIIYLSLLASVFFRVLSANFPQFLIPSSFFWITAYGGFAIIYGPLLLRPKLTA